MCINPENISELQKTKIQFMIKSQNGTLDYLTYCALQRVEKPLFHTPLIKGVGSHLACSQWHFQQTTSGGMDGAIKLDFEV